MIRYRFGQNDLLRTRFAIAPLMELVGAVYVLRNPGRYVLHRRWAQWARPRTEPLELSLLEIAAPSGTPFWPVFIEPPPRAPHTQVADELQRVRGDPTPSRSVAEITRTYPGGVPAGQGFLDDPAGTLAELVTQMQALWEVALAPWWPQDLGPAGIRDRTPGRRLVAVGGQAAFTDLHPTVSWENGDLLVHPTRKPPTDVDLAGRGLLLVPAVFTWPSGLAAHRPALGPSPGLSAAPRDRRPLEPRRRGRRGRPGGRSWGGAAPRSCASSTGPAATLELARRLGREPGQRQ